MPCDLQDLVVRHDDFEVQPRFCPLWPRPRVRASLLRRRRRGPRACALATATHRCTFAAARCPRAARWRRLPGLRRRPPGPWLPPARTLPLASKWRARQKFHGHWTVPPRRPRCARRRVEVAVGGRVVAGQLAHGSEAEVGPGGGARATTREHPRRPHDLPAGARPTSDRRRRLCRRRRRRRRLLTLRLFCCGCAIAKCGHIARLGRGARLAVVVASSSSSCDAAPPAREPGTSGCLPTGTGGRAGGRRPR